MRCCSWGHQLHRLPLAWMSPLAAQCRDVDAAALSTSRLTPPQLPRHPSNGLPQHRSDSVRRRRHCLGNFRSVDDARPQRGPLLLPPSGDLGTRDRPAAVPCTPLISHVPKEQNAMRLLGICWPCWRSCCSHEPQRLHRDEGWGIVHPAPDQAVQDREAFFPSPHAAASDVGPPSDGRCEMR